MFGKSGLSMMSRKIRMDGVEESSSSTGGRCEVAQKMRRDLKDCLSKVPLMHCEKPVREADATCFTSTRLTALY